MPPPFFGLTPAAVLDTHFFQWFSLDPVEEPPVPDPARPCFRPSGERFHELVRLCTPLDAKGLIREAILTLDREFVDRPGDNPFARDIAKSLLEAALPLETLPEIRRLRDELSDFAAGGAPVIRRAGAPVPPPSGSPSTLYQVFLGEREGARVGAGAWNVAAVNEEQWGRGVWVMTLTPSA